MRVPLPSYEPDKSIITVGNTMFVEKRAEKRYAKKLVSVATITHCDEDPSLHGCPIKCETVDISGHGIQFRSDLQLQPGTSLSITIAYKPSETYSIAGEVRWCKLENGEWRTNYGSTTARRSRY